jgi:hypothetical protein
MVAGGQSAAQTSGKGTLKIPFATRRVAREEKKKVSGTVYARKA